MSECVLLGDFSLETVRVVRGDRGTKEYSDRTLNPCGWDYMCRISIEGSRGSNGSRDANVSGVGQAVWLGGGGRSPPSVVGHGFSSGQQHVKSREFRFKYFHQVTRTGRCCILGPSLLGERPLLRSAAKDSFVQRFKCAKRELFPKMEHVASCTRGEKFSQSAFTEASSTRVKSESL